jgi:hypothetical protein
MFASAASLVDAPGSQLELRSAWHGPTFDEGVRLVALLATSGCPLAQPREPTFRTGVNAVVVDAIASSISHDATACLGKESSRTTPSKPLPRSS